MYLVDQNLFDKLSAEDKQLIESGGKAVSDEDKIEQIEAIVAENNENNMDDDMSEVKYGDEEEYASKMDADGRMEDMPESKKNSFKSFDQAHEQGNALIRKLSDMPEMGMKKKKDKVENIPTNKETPAEKTPTY